MRLDVLQILRQRRDLDETDMSQDSQILAMTPIEKLEELFGFELGTVDWANITIDWMRECGFEVTSCNKRQRRSKKASLKV
jgi:hypothetical protein